MTSEQVTALAILVGAAALFVHGRLRVDFVALLVMLALAATGLCTPAEAVGGFGSTVVVLIGCLLVVGEGLSRTGTASLVGDAILRAAGGHEGRTRTMLVLAAAVLGSVMSSTAVVALFLPVALRIAAERQLAPARLLLPMAYGALVSGMLTLIGTAPNLVVHAELRGAGRAGFRMFDFTPVGGTVLAALLAAFAVGGRWLLPRRERAEAMPARPSVRELWQRFVPAGTLARFAVVPGSSLVGATARDTELGSRHGARVVAIQRQQPRSWRAAVLEPSPDHRFQAGDVVTVVGAAERLEALAPAFGLQRLPALPDASAALDAGFGVAVVMVPPESKLVGKSLAEVGFRTHHHLDVAGLRRDGEAVPDFVRTPLRAADMLLVLGPWARIRGLRDASHDLVVLTLPAESTAAAPARDRLPHALLILLAMVVVSALGAVPMVLAALAAAVAMVALRCVRLGDVYQAMSWSSLVLVAGMLPLATALDRTGVLALAVDGLQGLLDGAGPRMLLAVLFVVTAAIGSFLSNTATAVLMAPLALRLAESLQVAPEPLAMGVAIACSSAYLTPMGSPVVTLVYEAGGYRPGDLLRAGLPMFLATLLACVVLLPWLLPF